MGTLTPIHHEAANEIKAGKAQSINATAACRVEHGPQNLRPN